MPLSALTSGTPTTGAAQATQPATAAAPAAPDVPEGGISLFSGVLPRAFIGGVAGAAAGFILPWGGPIIGGLMGAVAGAGLKIFTNWRTIKSIQEYNAAALAQTGTQPTSEEEATALVSGQVPDQAVTQAAMGSLIQEAATQQAQNAGTATGQSPVGDDASQVAQSTGQTGTTQQASTGNPLADKYQMLVTPKGNFVVPKDFTIPTASGTAQEAEVYAQLQAEHDKAVAALQAAKAGSTGAGVTTQQPSQQPAQEGVQAAPDPVPTTQSQSTGTAPSVPTGGGTQQAATGASATAGGNAGKLAMLQESLRQLEEANKLLAQHVERLREERANAERRRRRAA